MSDMLTCKKSVLIGFIITTLTIVVVVIIGKWCICYSLLVFTWVAMIFYCLNKLKERIALFCFGIVFFTFLMGRIGIEPFLNEQFVADSSEVSNHACLSMWLAITGVWFAVIFFSPSSQHRNKLFKLSDKEKIRYGYVRRFSLISFYVVYPFAIIVNLSIGYFVLKYGYAAKFTDMRVLVENSPIFYTISKIELLLPTSFSIFIATLPSKKDFLRILKPYIIYLVLTLCTGGRGDFILGILLIVIGMVFMQKVEPKIVWINKRTVKVLLFLGVPLIAVGGTLMNIVRFGESVDSASITDSFLYFFYDQGVSYTTITNAYIYEDYIPKQDDFYTFEFLHSGLFARILGNEVYQGNNIEHATKGGSFTHALGYTIMGNAYLAGRGTGTSYVAELYYDFGYMGILLGSILYGYLFSLMNNLSKTGLFSRSLIFIVMTKLLWAPRGGYSMFLGFLFAPTTIILLIFVFSAAQISYVHYTKNHGHISFAK